MIGLTSFCHLCINIDSSNPCPPFALCYGRYACTLPVFMVGIFRPSPTSSFPTAATRQTPTLHEDESLGLECMLSPAIFLYYFLPFLDITILHPPPICGGQGGELGLAAYHSLLSLTRSLEMLMALFSIVELLVSSIRPLFVLQHQLHYRGRGRHRIVGASQLKERQCLPLTCLGKQSSSRPNSLFIRRRAKGAAPARRLDGMK